MSANKMLEISAVILGQVNVIYPTLLWDADSAVLVDAGYPGQMPLLRAAMEKAGVPLERLSAVLLTHQDIDHIGGLPALLKEAPSKVEVWSSEAEKPFIQGDQRLLKLTPEAIAKAAASLPAALPESVRQAFRATLENPPRASVDRTIADGEQLPCCGRPTVVQVPGHTPGHLCLHHAPSKTLVAGDALQVVDGQLQGPDSRSTLDMDAALQSLKKLAQYDIEAVICYHGGLYRGEANRRIAELARG